MLKTFLIDGDKGGVGKSLAARALVHHYVAQPEAKRPRLLVFDADRSNPDVCGEGGLQADGAILGAALIDLSSESGWIDFGTRIAMAVEESQTVDYRIIVNMPAQIGSRAFDGSIPIVDAVLREAHAVPVWLLSRTQESIRALRYRLRHMAARYGAGLVVKNLFFGQAQQFSLWTLDALRRQLVEEGAWVEAELPELNDQLTVMLGRKPLHDVLAAGIDGKPLPFGYRLALQSWLDRSGAAMAKVEAVGNPAGKVVGNAVGNAIGNAAGGAARGR
uniref:CobQ/CobB/MinD/ParA nucleotide binding domain-containing protein n=1 Tax=mine drainage metagenome TaxID=410659 RepID=E6PP70_9ZZZZ